MYLYTYTQMLDLSTFIWQWLYILFSIYLGKNSVLMLTENINMLGTKSNLQYSVGVLNLFIFLNWNTALFSLNYSFYCVSLVVASKESYSA